MIKINSPEQPGPKKFWMVKGDGPTSIHHHSREAAEHEAKRLAKTHEGKYFYVLEVTKAYVAVSPITEVKF